jgi:hypothetical protein
MVFKQKRQRHIDHVYRLKNDWCLFTATNIPSTQHPSLGVGIIPKLRDGSSRLINHNLLTTKYHNNDQLNIDFCKSYFATQLCSIAENDILNASWFAIHSIHDLKSKPR